MIAYSGNIPFITWLGYAPDGTKILEYPHDVTILPDGSIVVLNTGSEGGQVLNWELRCFASS
ncbi:MAG: hypothetical protein AB1546_11730 [bacterium]